MSAARPTGLLTADDYAAARQQGLLGLGTGLLAASGGGPYANLNQRLALGLRSGQSAYQEALDQQAKQAQAGQAYDFDQLKMQAAQQGMADQQKLAAGRARIIQQNPLPDQSNPQATAAWIDRVLPQFIMLGDTDTLGKLSEIRKSLGGSVATANLGDRMQFYNPQTGAVIREAPIAASPNALMVGERFTPATQARIEQGIISRFDAQTKDYTKAHEAWSQVDHVLQRALSDTHSPDDIIQLVDGISRLNNPGAVVRVGTVQIQLQKIGSYADKLRMWLGRGAKGAWPTDIVKGIARAAREIASEHAKQYNDLRAKAVKRGEQYGMDYMGDVLPNVWSDFGSDAPSGADVPALSTFNFGGAGFGGQP